MRKKKSSLDEKFGHYSFCPDRPPSEHDKIKLRFNKNADAHEKFHASSRSVKPRSHLANQPSGQSGISSVVKSPTSQTETFLDAEGGVNDRSSSVRESSRESQSRDIHDEAERSSNQVLGLSLDGLAHDDAPSVVVSESKDDDPDAVGVCEDVPTDDSALRGTLSVQGALITPIRTSEFSLPMKDTWPDFPILVKCSDDVSMVVGRADATGSLEPYFETCPWCPFICVAHAAIPSSLSH